MTEERKDRRVSVARGRIAPPRAGAKTPALIRLLTATRLPIYNSRAELVDSGLDRLDEDRRRR